MSLRPLIALLALTAVLAGATAGSASAPVPVLGSDPGYDTKGFGHAHPSLIVWGGEAVTFNLDHVRWKHWGAKQATGTGKGWLVPPGKPISGGHIVTENLVAYDLGTCKGKRAYRRMARIVPSLGQHFHPSSNDRIFCA
jgi:hypothetical protein